MFLKQDRPVANTFVPALYTAVVSFLAYATVYAFRKPFTVGTYAGAGDIIGLPYKDALVICQLIGYMLSKFYGIRFISSLPRTGRTKLIFLLVFISWIALLLFPLIPAPFNVLCLLINGFPLGIIWGIIFSYVEGRRATDFIGAALAVSFIFSSGFVKSVSQTLKLFFHINDWWLPFFTGLIFMLPLILFLYLLERIPPPTEEDIASRVSREPMSKPERKNVLLKFGTGIALLVLIYVFLTIFRDLRDNFFADILKETGIDKDPSVFVATEIPSTLLVLVMISIMVLIKNNRKAFLITHLIILAGLLMAGFSSYLFVAGKMNVINWLTLVGIGLYTGYIPFNCILFDRMIASFGMVSNAGFLMYLADSFGYLGSLLLLLFKTIFHIQYKWSYLYSHGVILLSVAGIVLTVWAFVYFLTKYKTADT